VPAVHRGAQVADPQPAAANACSAPSSEPVNTTPPATAGWTPSSTPVDAVHDRPPVAASEATSRLRQRRFRAEHVGEGGLDVSVGQATHPARDDQRLQRVGAGDAGAEQPAAARLVGAAQLRAGPFEGTRSMSARRRAPPRSRGRRSRSSTPSTPGSAHPTPGLLRMLSRRRRGSARRERARRRVARLGPASRGRSRTPPGARSSASSPTSWPGARASWSARHAGLPSTRALLVARRCRETRNARPRGARGGAAGVPARPRRSDEKPLAGSAEEAAVSELAAEPGSYTNRQDWQPGHQ